MGKGEDDAVWLSPSRTGPFQFYQYFIGLSDEDAKNTSRLLLPLEEEELNAAISEHVSKPALRSLQIFLATRITALVHSAEAANLACSASKKIYGSNASILTDDELALCPKVCIPRAELLAIDLKSLLLKCYPTIPRRTHPALFYYRRNQSCNSSTGCVRKRPSSQRLLQKPCFRLFQGRAKANQSYAREQSSTGRSPVNSQESRHTNV